MARFIRWQGIAGFFIISLLIAAFVYFFAESLVKSSIEFGVGKLTGAEVNVSSVEITYSPVSVKINDFQATDASAPTTNSVSFNSATAQVDLWQYFFGKMIIEEISVDALAFSTPRKQAGEVFVESDIEPEKQEADSEPFFTTPDISLPEPSTLLADVNLLTVKEGQLLKESYREEREKIQQLKAKLPNKNTLADYKAQVKALGKVKVKSLADIEKIKRDYDAIKLKFNADKALVKQAKQELADSKKRLATRVTALKAAPKKDWKVVEDKYQLDKVDGADFAHILFGQQARQYYQYGEMAVDKLKPLWASDEDDAKALAEAEANKANRTGRFVHFVEDEPLPTFLIKKAYISIISHNGDFSAEIDEITHQHWVRNKPTHYQLSSTNFINNGDALIKGELVLSQTESVIANGMWQVSNVTLEDVALQDSRKFSLSIAEGVLEGSGKYNLAKQQINSVNRIDLSQTRFVGRADSQLSEILIDTFASMNALALGVNATGQASSPDWQVTSPLNNLLKDAMQKQLQKKLAKFQASVQTGLNQKMAEQLNISDKAAGELVQLDTLLNDTDKSLDNLLSADVVEQQKAKYLKEAEDKLKNKAKDKANKKLDKVLGKFF